MSKAAEPAKPDILIVVADDLRPDVLHTLGHPTVKTPHLDALAGRGTVFTRAACGYPICHVSRTEMLSGRCVVKAASTGGNIPFPAGWVLWPQAMKSAGWHTVHSGKWHVHGTPVARGYAATAGLFSSGGAGKDAALTSPQSATGRPVTGYKGWTFKSSDGKAMPELGVGLTPDTDSHIADAASQVLQSPREKPLFLHVNFTATHDPLHWPKGKEGRFKTEDTPLPANFRPQHPFDHGNINGRDEVIVPAPRTEEQVKAETAVYLALVEQLDAQIGKLVKALEDTGRLSNTLIIFTSDQGLALGSHGLMGKQNQYEHTINAPLIMAGPGIPSGKRFSAQCYLRDLYPTVCELTGVEIPESVEGKSLLPVLRGGNPEIHGAIFGYFTDTQRMVRTTDGWKLIWYPQANRTQLFHLSEDPHELQDLASQPEQAQRREAMMGELKKWMVEKGDPILRKE
ncbi:arylsulfatase A-like enzyme [Roseimicrobium gellanilyticum]|uniref:Arylsulfatase A-like enzyme n=2 Tax=Roseimicrobium gellanilyticum TaxID=748857 RepID=A0A366HT92_9BACT|nr:arylsulfatase A-like enzyme [Roseimicrobium gellanilyticum]